jgi:hypothetical protein
MSLTLESLGFTKDELQQRVIDQLCESILSGKSYGEDGESIYEDSQFKRKLDEKLKAHIDQTIGAIAEKHVLPNVTQYVETLTIQETNKWGEAKGKKVTFVEYLTQRAEAYIQEEVSSQGKSKAEADSYNWSKSTTRIAYLINAHLQYSIETAMKQALATANSAIAGGIEKAVKVKLEEIVAGMKVAVSAGR